jgi:hypothetical protein
VVSQVILDPEHVRSAYPPARAEAAPTASTTLSAALAAAPTR